MMLKPLPLLNFNNTTDLFLGVTYQLSSMNMETGMLLDVDCQSREQTKNTYLDGFFVFYQSSIPLAYISPGYFKNNAIPNLNSWIIHVYMKQERNHRKVWETSFKNKTRVLSIYTFISTNPSAISLAKARNFIGFIWSHTQCHL